MTTYLLKNSIGVPITMVRKWFLAECVQTSLPIFLKGGNNYEAVCVLCYLYKTLRSP